MSVFDWVMSAVAIVLFLVSIGHLIGNEPAAAMVYGVMCVLCVVMVVLQPNGGKTTAPRPQATYNVTEARDELAKRGFQVATIVSTGDNTWQAEITALDGDPCTSTVVITGSDGVYLVDFGGCKEATDTASPQG